MITMIALSCRRVVDDKMSYEKTFHATTSVQAKDTSIFAKQLIIEKIKKLKNIRRTFLQYQ